MSKRCTGHCCREFVLRSGNTYLTPQDVESLADASEENATIAQLAIPFYGPLAPNGIWYYTCKHFDGKNCTIYAHRPKMCRDYGTVTPCTHNGCTYEP